jgi:hypothetical protein
MMEQKCSEKSVISRDSLTEKMITSNNDSGNRAIDRYLIRALSKTNEYVCHELFLAD